MSLKVGDNLNYSLYYDNKGINKDNKDNFNKVLNDNIRKDSIEINTHSSDVIKASSYFSSKNNLDYDKKQSIIEDKFVYDAHKLNDKGIEFGSKEWEEWKATLGTGVIPRLNEPWQIRRAWREAFEECKTPGEYKEVSSLFRTLFSVENKGEEEYSKKIECSGRANNYLGFLANQKSFYNEIAKSDLSNSYSIFLSTIDKITNKISSYTVKNNILR